MLASQRKDEIQNEIGNEITKAKNKRKPMTNTHLKYIDDLTLATAINLKETLVENPSPTHPTTYHDRTMHLLPKENDTIQQEFNRLQ